MAENGELVAMRDAAEKYIISSNRQYPVTIPAAETFKQITDPNTWGLRPRQHSVDLTSIIGVDDSTNRGLAAFLNTFVIQPPRLEVTGQLKDKPNYSVDYWVLKGLMPVGQLEVRIPNDTVNGYEIDPSGYENFRHLGVLGFGYKFDSGNLPDIKSHPRQLEVNLKHDRTMTPPYTESSPAGKLIQEIEEVMMKEINKLLAERGEKILTKRVRLRDAAFLTERRLMRAFRRQTNELIEILKDRGLSLGITG